MRLTYRDGITTALAVAVVLVTLTVTSPRIAIVILTAIGATMCGVGSRAAEMATGGEFKRHPAMVLSAVLGVLALAIAIAGLVTGAEGFVTFLAADILLLWVIATVRHASVPASRAPEPAPAMR